MSSTRISLVGKDILVDQLKTTEPSSMQYYGSSGQVLPGGAYHQTMETGRRHTGDSANGEIKVYGRSYWR
jgi:hypothetical protein